MSADVSRAEDSQSVQISFQLTCFGSRSTSAQFQCPKLRIQIRPWRQRRFLEAVSSCCCFSLLLLIKIRDDSSKNMFEACFLVHVLRHVVFFNVAATGHMNPTLPLATELVARGVHVSYFVHEKVRSVVEATGTSDSTASGHSLHWHCDPHRNPGVQKARQEIKDTYDFDVFEHGTFLEFYSPDQNLVCTSNSLYVAPKTEVQLERFPHFPFECVGPLLNSKIQRLHNADVSDSDSVKLPAAVEDAVAAGKRLVYISPGTVATGHFWTEKLGAQAMRGTQERSQRIYWESVCSDAVSIEALGNDPDIQVVISTGGKEDTQHQ
eukprot:Skav201965  [mRNA]  locus=scaffold103:263006:265433:+ [translate_table: standard]